MANGVMRWVLKLQHAEAVTLPWLSLTRPSKIISTPTAGILSALTLYKATAAWKGSARLPSPRGRRTRQLLFDMLECVELCDTECA